MESENSAQDVLRCQLCETPVPPLYCDICQVNLCKACAGEHLLDETNVHNVLPIKQQWSANYPKCPIHVTKQCELHCEQCDIPLCTLCVSSNEHLGHIVANIVEIFKSKKEIIEKEFKELKKNISPKYQEIASNIHVQRDNIEQHSQESVAALTKQGEALHREIDTIINRRKSEIGDMRAKYLAVLDKQEEEITNDISEITLKIENLKKLRESNDVYLVATYKFGADGLRERRFPSKLRFVFPRFTPGEIDTEQLNKHLGSLSEYSVHSEERQILLESPIDASLLSDTHHSSLLDQCQIITTINTEYTCLYNVHCLNDDTIWISGENNILKLFNLHGTLLKQIRTKSGNTPLDIAATRSGDLIYTDPKDGSVNMLKNQQIQKVIKLKEWIPTNVCSTMLGDILVISYNKNIRQTKVVSYSGTSKKQTIKFDKGQPLFSFDESYHIKYICENRNHDICVSDNAAQSLVVVNRLGKLRFRYNGSPNSELSFNPRDITTDSQSRILVIECNNDCIHILDKDGKFLHFIDNCDLQYPWGLCVDTRDNLFVAERDTCRIKKIKYSI